MDAKEAKQIAERSRIQLQLRELDETLNYIKENAKKGLFSVATATLMPETKMELEKLGYSVEFRQCGMSEYEYVITW